MGDSNVLKTLIYYEEHEPEVRKKKSWTVRGHRNSLGLHPDKDDETASIVFGKKPGIFVTASYYEE